MSATLTSTPVIDALMAAISCLTPEEKGVLVERVQDQMEKEEEIPQWQMDILKERETLYRKGLDEPIPVEEAFRQIRETLRKERLVS